MRTRPLKRTGFGRGGYPAGGKPVSDMGTPPSGPGLTTRKPLKLGRGFAASPQQREKVRGMACANCGYMGDDYAVIDPAHICAKGMGGCDHEDCVIPLCRWADAGCHPAFDRGELDDLLPKLEPAFRREVAHAVMHLGLEGTRRRLCPSLYGASRLSGEREEAA